MSRLALGLLGVLTFFLPVRGQTPAEKKATIAYLHTLQREDGSFSPVRAANGRPPVPSNLRATTMALRALKYFGGQPGNPETCARYVRSCLDRDSGGFGDTPAASAKPDVIATAIGLMAIIELKMPRQDFAPGAVAFLGDRARTFEEIRFAAAGLEAIGQRAPQAGAWRDLVVRMRNPDGTFGKDDGLARDTASAVVILLRLGAAIESRDKLVEAIRAGQRGDGGFGKAGTPGSDLETAYRVLRALVMLGDKPADPGRLRAFVARCRNDDGGYGVVPGQASGAAGTYFAAIVLHWLGDL